MAMVEATMELPVSVEKLDKENPGTTMVLANKVETVRDELKYPVLEVMDEMAMVEAIIELPVSVEKLDKENPGTINVLAKRVEVVT